MLRFLSQIPRRITTNAGKRTMYAAVFGSSVPSQCKSQPVDSQQPECDREKHENSIACKTDSARSAEGKTDLRRVTAQWCSCMN